MFVIAKFEFSVNSNRTNHTNISGGKLWNNRTTPKWVTKSLDNRCEGFCGWNSIQDMASSFVFYPFFQKGQGYRHLGHWMLLIGLYLGTKCEVCRWNRICDMTSCLVFVYFWEDMTLTFDLDRRSSTFGSLNAPDWVVPWYQVWSV